MEYKDIKNMDELHRAISDLSLKIDQAKGRIVESSRTMREEMTPINLAGKAIKTASDRSKIPYDRNLLGIVRSLRKAIERL